MGKVIAKNVVDRKQGYLYYVDGKGNVCEAKMSRGGRKKKAKKKTTARKTTRKTTKRKTTARRTTARRTTRRKR
ncbi:hypothetical protein COU62_04685 [Candidatus Pacearchaeota archaeon CG10_big_fil_rev_8_21_14_0_10_35_219]|nr:MAG: hypothetical protein AUJ63_01715 [Candidatus Pacearchaeota archaeon CG1_02_35_32]PIO07099.1 MAG: hypothetical protein COU62_04685 [Candidatus Pacearchaeota archaeon CG10_big_fil_rev_8_21_14_0_10_35_219]PIY81642.1 MAG: hypothetical protein COY79_01460 [Candidatus Pacearchaeota archaeon CG_4_10_14_0_8_um_filter_35_169]PIZ80894.1 MAG: hypothetical protein COY00_00040 [Candidatus Pacearchaeota archaeon CG_4_10_14_0_2_um_filter_35_33]PJA70432.1 MAG: hypothetical protein CO155_00215 [Candidat